MLYSQDPYPDNVSGHFKFYQGGTAPVASTDQARSGTTSGAFTVEQGDPDWPGRCEVVPDSANFVENDDRWFTFSTYLGAAFDTDAGTWQVVTQWKNDGIGSPPLEVSVADDLFYIGGGYGWPGGTDTPVGDKLAQQSLGAATTETWVDWQVHILFSSDPDVGYVEVWKNGAKVLEPWKPPGGTLYPELYSYLKIGYYRDDAIATTATVYHDNWVIGTGPVALWSKESGDGTSSGWVPVVVSHGGTVSATALSAETVTAGTVSSQIATVSDELTVGTWATVENLDVNGTVQSWLTTISFYGVRLRAGGGTEYEWSGQGDGNLWLAYNATYGETTRAVLRVNGDGQVRVCEPAQGIEFGSGGPLDLAGAGTPEGSITAPVGSTYRRTDGGAGTSFYVKESGTGSTGWVGK